MRRWFRSQPIHRKLVLTSMVKTTVVLFAAMVVLLVMDSLRFQTNASADATTLAQMVAENVRAAVTFGEYDDAAVTLSTLRHRSQVQRGCVYDTSGALVARYERPGGQFPCPKSMPPPQERPSLSATEPVVTQSGTVGYVYVDRDWAALKGGAHGSAV